VTRLAATLGVDMRVQFRNGFYAATALVVAASIALLRWLPADTAALLLPVVILENVLINTFYFVSGLLLLERDEGTLAAQNVTPLRGGEYLASKVVTLTALSLAESLLITIAVAGFDGRLVLIAVGVALAAALFCLAGVALVVRYESINEFIMPSVLYAFVLSLPVVGYFGVGARAWYLAHPVQGALDLMRLQAPASPGGLAYAIGYPLLWMVPFYLWSRRAMRRVRAR
jgi:fluoroquinolone transport system permease protein